MKTKPIKKDSVEKLLSKMAENLVSQRAIAIDNFLLERIPNWQVIMMKKLPITKKLFGYEIVQCVGFNNFNYKIELKKHGELIGTLNIIMKIKEQ